jgi:penicillin-binding protein 1A
MVEAGFMTEGEVYAARQNPARIVDRSEIYAPNYFLDWAFQEAQRLAGDKDFVLTVRTTVDLDLQKAAEAAIASSLQQYGETYGAEQAAMVAVELDGAVRAMVGGRDYGDSQFNRAADALRQPGSSFKPFVYMTALMNGYTPRTVVYDAPITIGNWSPKNYSRSYRGPVTLTTALQKSINTIPVRLAQAIGRGKIRDTAQKMGIRSEILITRAMPLGVAEVTVLDMASAYATIANGGRSATPYGILEIRSSTGELLYDRARDETPQQRILPADKVADLTMMMSTVVEAGTGRRAMLDFTVAGGKTGTTQAYRDAWFIGFTGKYSAAVWFGNDDFSSTRRMTGGTVPAMTWKSFMDVAHRDRDIAPLVGAIDPRGVMQKARVDVAARQDSDGEGAPGSRIAPLSRELGTTLGEIENMFRGAKPVPVPGPPVPVSERPGEPNRKAALSSGALARATP